jgi:hypothetical protein
MSVRPGAAVSRSEPGARLGTQFFGIPPSLEVELGMQIEF